MRWRHTLSVGLLCAAVAIAINAVMLHQVGFSGDEAYYARMAAHPAGPHNFPYAFRVGVPFLVHLLPISRSAAWMAVALTAAAIAAAGLYALLAEFAIPPRLAAGLAVGFIVSPPLLVTFLRNGISVDPATVMILTLAALFIVRRNRLALAVVLLAGVSVHESCLYAIPLAYAVWARRPVDGQALRDLALVAVVPALVYLYLRSSIVAVGEQYQPGYNGAFVQPADRRHQARAQRATAGPGRSGGSRWPTGRCGWLPRWPCATSPLRGAGSSWSRCAWPR